MTTIAHAASACTVQHEQLERVDSDCKLGVLQVVQVVELGAVPLDLLAVTAQGCGG